VAAGVGVNRPRQRRAWLSIAAGLLTWTWAGAAEAPAGVDGLALWFTAALQLLPYPLLLGGLLALAAGHGSIAAEARRSLVDAAVVVVAVSELAWLGLRGDAGAAWTERALTGADAALDVLVLAAALRLADASAWAPCTVRLLTAGFALLLGADAFGSEVALGIPAPAAAAAAVLGYGLVVAAGLHPSMAALGALRRGTATALPPGLLVVLAASASVLPAVLLAGGLRPRDPEDMYALGAGSTALVLLLLVRLVGLVRSLEQREREMRHLAIHDPLTGLPNRRALEEALGQIVRRAPAGRPAMLLLIDLDRFKLINDTLGHSAGDRALAEVGKKLEEALRPGDFLARFGGDEFAAIVHDVGADEARQVAERVVRRLSSLRFRDGEHVFDITASVGACPIDGRQNAERVLSIADWALYEAKGAWKRTAGSSRPPSSCRWRRSSASCPASTAGSWRRCCGRLAPGRACACSSTSARRVSRTTPCWRPSRRGWRGPGSSGGRSASRSRRRRSCATSRRSGGWSGSRSSAVRSPSTTSARACRRSGGCATSRSTS